jgi:hypothetical protein
MGPIFSEYIALYNCQKPGEFNMVSNEKERDISANKSLADADAMIQLLSQITRQVEEMRQQRRLMQAKDSQILDLDIINEELLKKLKAANVAYTLSNQLQSLRMENEELKSQIKIFERESKREKNDSV